MEYALWISAAILILAAGIFIGARISHLRAENKFLKILQLKEAEWQSLSDADKKQSLAKSRAVIGGNFSEQLAPYLPDFPFDPTEVRFVGKPVDLVVFRGLASGKVSEVVFVEIKSGQSRLNRNEASVKDAVLAGRVTFSEYRVPHDLTRGFS